MNIAIIDCVNQDIGLNILFPEADYYIHNDEEVTIHERIKSYSYYPINPIKNWSNINDVNYDYLFIIMPVYDIFFKENDSTPYVTNITNSHIKIMNLINQNNFKKIIWFDNHDYDYDPSEYLIHNKISFFFKRNYNENKNYNKNVLPFPFIMFGNISLIEKIDRDLLCYADYFKSKINRIFFSGQLFIHNDSKYNITIDRYSIYNKIQNAIYNPGYIPYDIFINEMRNSKVSLDLLGVGNPNKRTIEILLSGSLLLSQKNNLKWPFENGDHFYKETVFTDLNDFFKKSEELFNNRDLYDKCLFNQYNIVKKYFNKEWLRNYIKKSVM